jgi:hypothetical protein
VIGRPTYLFGAGATKAGTTRLLCHLAGRPDGYLRSVRGLQDRHSLAGAGDRQIAVSRRKPAAPLAVSGVQDRAALVPVRLLAMVQGMLMSAPGLAWLCAFSGSSAHSADISARMDDGAPLAMTAERKGRLRAFLQSQYDFVATAFPDMPESWRANLDGVTA